MIAALVFVTTAVQVHDFTPAAYRVLLVAAYLAEPDSSGRAVVEIRRQRLAAQIGCSVSTVNTALRELRAAGVLLVSTPAVTNGARDKRTSTVYAVLPHLEPWD